ncbi:MAG: hypothetical protein ACE5H3_03155 [Planctomycetota bacterium]
MKNTVPGHARNVGSDLWPGIDWACSWRANRLKHKLLARPGADPERIPLARRSVSGLILQNPGEPAAATPAGGFLGRFLRAWQIIDGETRLVSMHWAMGKGRSGEAFSLGLKLGAGEPAVAPILDPVVPICGGHPGGPAPDSRYGIAMDSMGRAFVSRDTASPLASVPIAVGRNRSWNGRKIASVARVAPPGTIPGVSGWPGVSLNDPGNPTLRPGRGGASGK